MTGSVELDLDGPKITVHGLFETPICMHYLTAGEAEQELRRLATLIVTQLREKSIAVTEQ